MKYLYEFIGTFFLVLTVGMTTLGPNNAFLFAPLAIGSIIAALVYAGAHVSGGHYNPAVSLAVFLDKKLTGKNLLLYWIAQIAAGVLAALIVIYLKTGTNDFPLAVNHWSALLSEFLFTFALCFVFLNATLAKATKGNSFYGLAIGLTVLAGSYAVGALSTTAFNPAAALALSILNLYSWPSFLVFLIANLLGAALAAWVFKKSHPYEENIHHVDEHFKVDENLIRHDK